MPNPYESPREATPPPNARSSIKFEWAVIGWICTILSALTLPGIGASEEHPFYTVLNVFQAAFPLSLLTALILSAAAWWQSGRRQE